MFGRRFSEYPMGAQLDEAKTNPGRLLWKYTVVLKKQREGEGLIALLAEAMPESRRLDDGPSPSSQRS